MPSSHLIPSPPAFSLSRHRGLFQGVSSSHQVAEGLESHGPVLRVVHGVAKSRRRLRAERHWGSLSLSICHIGPFHGIYKSGRQQAGWEATAPHVSRSFGMRVQLSRFRRSQARIMFPSGCCQSRCWHLDDAWVSNVFFSPPPLYLFSAVYANTELASNYLVRGSPRSQRDMLMYTGRTTYVCWGHLAEAVRWVLVTPRSPQGCPRAGFRASQESPC